MKTRVLMVALVGVVLWSVPVYAVTQVDNMTMHLTDQQVTDRNAEHSGRDVVGLIAESTRLGGGDPGQWWFSPARGLGFDATRGGDRDHARWDMSTGGSGAGMYRLDLGGLYTLGGNRGIDVFLDGGAGAELVVDIDEVQGALSVDFMVSADDIDGSGNVRLHAAAGAGNGANGTIGDLDDGRTGTATLSFLEEYALTDSMTTHLTDQEVTDRAAVHSGRDAVGLIAESTRLAGDDPGQWWFSPVRGLGFDSSRGGDRDNAEWSMSTDGKGAGDYRLIVVGVDAHRNQGRGIDLMLGDVIGGSRVISDLDGQGTFTIDLTIEADEIDANGNIRLLGAANGVHPVTGSRQNGTIGDLGNNRQGQVHLLFAGAAALLPGDANGDGCVDDLDLTALAVNWQQSTDLWENGDFNGDGIVDDLDLTALAVNWQQGCGGGGSFADTLAGQNIIPEPATALIVLLGFAGVVRRRK